MTEMLRPRRTADRYAQWVAMWREAVHASRLTIGLVELSTTRFIELSPSAAELLGTTLEEGSGLNYLSVAEHPREAAETFRLVQQGILDGIWAHRRFRQPDGSMFEVQSSGWAIRSPAGPDLGLWMAREVRSDADHAAAEEVVIASHSRHAGSEYDDARVTLDDHWRMAHIGTNAGLLLGRPPAELLANSIIELTHPDDLGALLFAFARSTTNASVGARVRLRHHDGSWRTCQVTPSVLDGDGMFPFTMVLAVDQDPEAQDSRGEVLKLAGHLRRIAAQIEAAGVLGGTADHLGVPIMTELSARQREIVSRLVRGERVASIAAEIYLSPSTVRNHLSAIFRKVGVHSQQEFLALWRDDARGHSV